MSMQPSETHPYKSISLISVKSIQIRSNPFPFSRHNGALKPLIFFLLCSSSLTTYFTPVLIIGRSGNF